MISVGDEIPTMVFDGDDNLVGAVMAVVVRVGNGQYEVEYPDGSREVIPMEALVSRPRRDEDLSGCQQARRPDLTP